MITKQGKPPTANSVQELQNDSFDRKWNTLVFQIVAEAVDGPDAGDLIYIKAGYNNTTGNYELLTAGSGGTPATPYYLLLEDDSYLLQESGDKIIL
jgi:hypothetical protein